MQLPFVDEVTDARPVRAMLGLVVFLVAGCLLSGVVGFIRMQQYQTDVRLQHEGVCVDATITNLRRDVRYTGTGSNRRQVDELHVDVSYGVGSSAGHTATFTVDAPEFSAMQVGGTFPLVVAATDPSVYDRPENVEASRSQTPSGIWGESLCGGFCCSGVVGLMFAFAMRRKRRSIFSRLF